LRRRVFVAQNPRSLVLLADEWEQEKGEHGDDPDERDADPDRIDNFTVSHHESLVTATGVTQFSRHPEPKAKDPVRFQYAGY